MLKGQFKQHFRSSHVQSVDQVTVQLPSATTSFFCKQQPDAKNMSLQTTIKARGQKARVGTKGRVLGEVLSAPSLLHSQGGCCGQTAKWESVAQVQFSIWKILEICSMTSSIFRLFIHWVFLSGSPMHLQMLLTFQGQSDLAAPLGYLGYLDGLKKRTGKELLLSKQPFLGGLLLGVVYSEGITDVHLYQENDNLSLSPISPFPLNLLEDICQPISGILVYCASFGTGHGNRFQGPCHS